MFLIKPSPSVASAAVVPRTETLLSSQSRERNNCSVIGLNCSEATGRSPIGFSITSTPTTGNSQPDRRSFCSVNSSSSSSSSSGSRCSSRGSSSSGTSGRQESCNLVTHLSAQAAIHHNNKSGIGQADPLVDPLESLSRQLANRAARANSFSRVNLKQHQQNFKSSQQSTVSISELVDKYLTPTRIYASNLKQPQRAAANRSQSVSVSRYVKRPSGSGQRSSNPTQAFECVSARAESKTTRAPKRVNSCISTSSASAAAARQSEASPSRGTRARIVKYVSSVRASSLSSIQTRFSSTNSGSYSSSSATADPHHHHHHNSHQHHSLLHGGKRHNARSSSTGGASLLSSLLGTELSAHSAPSSSVVNCVKREITKLFKSF